MEPHEYDRIAARLQHDANGCWTWTGALLKSPRPGSGGYGLARVGGKTALLHRAMYEHFVGPIPAGLSIDHLCRNRACCNPEHLEPVTHKTNTLRGVGPTAVNAAKTNCPKGHPYDGDNLHLDKQGRRHCRTCSREAQQAWIARKVAETGNPDWFRDYKRARRRESPQKE